MYYAYIIQSQKDKSLYTGVTSDLRKRIEEHNQKRSTYTSAKTPYRLIRYCAFEDKLTAYRFEKYLKTGSGIAFYKKHLINNQ